MDSPQPGSSVHGTPASNGGAVLDRNQEQPLLNLQTTATSEVPSPSHAEQIGELTGKQPDATPQLHAESSVVSSTEHTSNTSSSSIEQASVWSDIPSITSLESSAPPQVFQQLNSPPAPIAAADEQEDLDAVTQAEDGHIIVDSDEASDGGYGSDVLTAASTSLASSVRDFAFENGRRYHRFREGRYNFPNDDVEQEREDMKHAMVKMLCQQLHFAPLGDHPQQILDIGTGTGIWAIEMGDQYTSANVLGVDLSPIQPEWVPPNVRFMVDDVESPWLHPSNYFDYIHSRHTVMAIKDWPKLFRRSLEHLRPGGWMELQEIYHYPISDNGRMKPDHPVAQYWALINQGLTNLGVDFHAASDARLGNMMRECGFVNVSERVFHVPIGTWPKNKVLKTVGLYWRTILLDGIQAIALGPLTRGCKWTKEQVEVLLISVRKAYYDNSSLMYMPLRIVYAQKPETVYGQYS